MNHEMLHACGREMTDTTVVHDTSQGKLILPAMQCPEHQVPLVAAKVWEAVEAYEQGRRSTLGFGAEECGGSTASNRYWTASSSSSAVVVALSSSPRETRGVEHDTTN